MNREQMISHLTLCGWTARGKYRNLGIQRIDGSRVLYIDCGGKIKERALFPRLTNDWKHVSNEELDRFITYLNSP